MTDIPAVQQGLPKDRNTGLTLPLSRSLDSRSLDRHRALLAIELEVLAKKLDRWGWERDRGTASHDRIVTDWMDALQDFPLHEVQAACAAAVRDNPNRMPNEGHILAGIMAIRRDAVRERPKPSAPPEPKPVTAEQARAIMERAGLSITDDGRLVGLGPGAPR